MKGTHMGWSSAYNYNLGRTVSITETIELRNKYGRKDPRVGDLHCHKHCYHEKKGSRLYSRRESIDEKTGKIKKVACYAKWPSKYTKSGSYCGIESKSISQRESMDYAQYFFMMEGYLNQLSLDCEPYFIRELIVFESQNQFDFTIVHSNSDITGITKSNIVIIDENKRRLKISGDSKLNDDSFEIVIRISEFTPEQLIDFEKSGVEKLKLEWDYLQSLLLQFRADDTKEEKISIEDFNRSERDYLEVILNGKSSIESDQVKVKESRISDFQSLVDQFDNGLEHSEENYKQLIGIFSSFIQIFCNSFGYQKSEIQNEEFPLELWAEITPRRVRYSKEIKYSEAGESQRLIRYLEENHNEIHLARGHYEGLKKYMSLPLSEKTSQSKIDELFSRLNNHRRAMLPSVKPVLFKKFEKEIKSLREDLKLPTFEDRHSIDFREWRGGERTLSWDELSDDQKLFEELGLNQNSRRKPEIRVRIAELQRCIYPDD